MLTRRHFIRDTASAMAGMAVVGGSELFYRGPRGMMAVPVDTEPIFNAGDPEVLFEQPYYSFRGSRTYDVASDGRFLMIKEGTTTDDGSAPTAQIILVENWFEELKARVPIP